MPSTCGQRCTSAWSRASAVRAAPWSKNVAAVERGDDHLGRHPRPGPVPARSISSAACWESSPGAVIESVGPAAEGDRGDRRRARRRAATPRSPARGGGRRCRPDGTGLCDSIGSSNDLVGRLRRPPTISLVDAAAPPASAREPRIRRPAGRERRPVLSADARTPASSLGWEPCSATTLRALWAEPRRARRAGAGVARLGCCSPRAWSARRWRGAARRRRVAAGGGRARRRAVPAAPVAADPPAGDGRARVRLR